MILARTITKCTVCLSLRLSHAASPINSSRQCEKSSVQFLLFVMSVKNKNFGAPVMRAEDVELAIHNISIYVAHNFTSIKFIECHAQSDG